MKIVIYRHPSGHPKSTEDAFAKGLTKHGLAAEFAEDANAPRDCDLAVFWGHKRLKVMAHQKKNGARYLVMERGYIGDRFYWTSLGFDGLNGRADFKNREMPEARFRKFFAQYMRPWREAKGKYVLLMGQVPGDASLAGVDIMAWYEGMSVAIKSAGHQLFFRPHPLDKHGLAPAGVNPIRGELAEVLRGAISVVTYNSNSAVDAIMAGVPAVAVDQGSMAWPVAGHTVSELERRPDRMQWGSDIAYAQWAPWEIENGIAWAHLAR